MTEPAIPQSYTDALTAIGESADQEIRGLSIENESLLAQIDTLVAESESAAATIKKLRAQLAKCRAQLPAKIPPIVFGSSAGAHTTAEFAKRTGGPLQARRSYQKIGQAFPTTDIADGIQTSLVSIASDPNAIDAVSPKITAYLQSVPSDHDVRLMVAHEPEAPSKFYAATAYVTQQQKVRVLVDQANDGRNVPIRFGGCFMAWSARPESHRDMGKFVPQPGTWDFLAWDGYTTEFRFAPVAVFDPAAVFTDALPGVNFAIAETGITTPDNTEIERVGWIKECRTLAALYGAEFWAYWDGKAWGDNPNAYADRTTGAYLLTDDEFKAVTAHG